MEEVASGSVGAVTLDPVLLAQLGLVFGVADDLSQLFASVGKLAPVSVNAPAKYVKLKPV